MNLEFSRPFAENFRKVIERNSDDDYGKDWTSLDVGIPPRATLPREQSIRGYFTNSFVPVSKPMMREIRRLRQILDILWIHIRS